MRASPGCGAARQKVPETELIRKERTMSSKSPRASKRISNGQWARGASGNPAGRPVRQPQPVHGFRRTTLASSPGGPGRKNYRVGFERRSFRPSPLPRTALSGPQGAAHRFTAAGSPECRGGHRRPFHNLDGRGRGSNHARRGSRPGRDRRNPTTPGGGGHADQSRKELEQQGKQMEAELASKLRGLCGPQRPVPCSTAPEPPSTAQPEAR